MRIVCRLQRLRRVWVNFFGRFIGHGRCDDLDQLQYCETCGGSGVSEVCENCLDAWEDEE